MKNPLSRGRAKKKFVFYEGPPTANGQPGIHSMEARVFKDIVLRYKAMRGFYCKRKAGWDTHGLPVEIQVEKELGLKNKKEIEEYGIEKFIEKCKESVWRYRNEWENTDIPDGLLAGYEKRLRDNDERLHRNSLVDFQRDRQAKIALRGL